MNPEAWAGYSGFILHPSSFILETLKLPPLAIVMLYVLIGLGAVGRPQALGVPLQFFTDPVSDVAEQHRLRQRAGVIEITGGGPAGLARRNPFLMVPDGIGNEWLGRHELGEVLFRPQHVLVVIGQQQTFLAHEQRAIAPG